MASILRSRKNELTDAQIAAVQLSNRQVHGEYVTYTALSSNGHDTYTVTLNAAGQPVGCTCPSTVPCKHRAAAAFEEAWIAPIANALDDMAEDEDEQMMGDLAAEIIRAELDRKIRAGIEADMLAELAQYEREVATAPAYVPEALESIEDIDGGMMGMIDAMQAEKARKLAAQARYREAWPEDFSYYHGAA